MGLKINKRRAREQLERSLKLARSSAELPSAWSERTQKVAQFEDKTCLVVLGTALLATATDDTVDALTLKSRAGNKAYSARGLAHEVLVPASIDHGFDLRTTGREPLNNQPFFYSDRVDDMPRVKHPGEIESPWSNALKRSTTFVRRRQWRHLPPSCASASPQGIRRFLRIWVTRAPTC